MGKNKPLKIFAGICTVALIGVGAFSAWQWDNVKLLKDCKPLVSQTQYTEQKNKNAELEKQFQEQLQKYTDLQAEKEVLEAEKEELQEDKETLQGSNQDLQNQNQNLQSQLDSKDTAIADKQAEIDSLKASLNEQGIYFVTYTGTNSEGEEVEKVKLCNGTVNVDELETPGDICAWSLDGETMLEGNVTLTENKTLTPLYAGRYGGNFPHASFASLINSGMFSLSNGTLNRGSVTMNAERAGNLRGTILLPKTVTTIGTSAFLNCTNLTKVKIPDSVTSIGMNAFSGSGITSFNSKSVNLVGREAFKDCTSLQSFNSDAVITEIGESAFASCTSLQSIELKEGLLKLGGYTFEDCTSAFEEILQIPNSVNEINCNDFQNTKVKHVILPTSMTTSGFIIFNYYPALKSIYVPNEVTYFMLNDGKMNIKNYGVNIYFEAETMPSTDATDISSIQNNLHTGYTLEQYLAEINTAT